MSRNDLSNEWFSSLFRLAFLSAAVWLYSMHGARAADPTAVTSLGQLFCSAWTNAKPLGNVFHYVAYVSGAIAILRGILGLKKHADNPTGNPLGTALMFLAGGTLLLALPGTINVLENSLYPAGATSGLGDCTAGDVAAATGLDSMLSGFLTNVKEPLEEVVSLTAILAGLFMIVNGLMKAAKWGTDPRANSIQVILANLLFGATLCTIGQNLTIMLNSVFGSTAITAPSALTWTGLNKLVGGSGLSTEFTSGIASALGFVQVVGAIAFVRGWLIMKKVVEGGSNASIGQGLTHILGGCLAINIGAFLQLMDYTFGTGLL